MRWGGASQWGHPLSVAQHSLTVLAIREGEGPLTAQEGLRELLHDATEFMLGWDCIAPLKAQLGAPFRQLEARLQAAIDARYQLPSWTAEAYAKHKRADRLAAASEAFHVVGWSRTDMVEALGIEIPPLLDDPLPSERVCALGAAAAPSGARSLHAAIPRTCSRVPAPAAIPNALLRTRAKPSCNAIPERRSCRIGLTSTIPTSTAIRVSTAIRAPTTRLTTNGRRSPANLSLARPLPSKNGPAMQPPLSMRSPRP